MNIISSKFKMGSAEQLHNYQVSKLADKFVYYFLLAKIACLTKLRTKQTLVSGQRVIKS